MEENGSITSNGAPKTNGTIKPDTNPELIPDKGNNNNTGTQQSNTNNVEPPTTDAASELLVTDDARPSGSSTDNRSNINPVTQHPKPRSPSPLLLLHAAHHPVNGVDTVAAANQKNSDSANTVIAPSASPALPDSSTTTPAVNETEASKDNAKVSPPTLNGTNELNNDGANKATTPASPEREEPGTFLQFYQHNFIHFTTKIYICSKTTNLSVLVFFIPYSRTNVHISNNSQTFFHYSLSVFTLCFFITLHSPYCSLSQTVFFHSCSL